MIIKEPNENGFWRREEESNRLATHEHRKQGHFVTQMSNKEGNVIKINEEQFQRTRGQEERGGEQG